MKLAQQLKEDRALRDAARALFLTDLQLIRQDVKERGVAQRLADRLGEGASDMMEDAVDYAADNRGLIGAAMVAAILWFARGPILRFFDDELDADPEPDEGYAGSLDN